MTRTRTLVVVGALAIAVAVALLAPFGRSSYRIHAHFVSASQLVVGGAVKVGGRHVGTITDIGVTPSGQADITLALDDDSVIPLHDGTRATVRALSQTGVANRYVELSPGDERAPEIHDGGTLPTTQTRSMVNLDAILDSFGPPQRRRLQRLIAHGAELYAGSAARTFNHMLAKLSPAVAELDGVTGELDQDGATLAHLIHTASSASRAIASRRTDLVSAVANTATTMRAIASDRGALSDALQRAPAVLDQARAPLAHLRGALGALRPTLREVVPAAAPLHALLTRVVTTVPRLVPVVAQLRREAPSLRATLAGLPPLAPVAVRGLGSAGKALQDARPILRVARYYGSDLLLGVLQGLVGVAAANYDRWGHYARVEFTQPYQTLLAGPASQLLTHPLAPSLFALRTGLLRRCPGGNAPPAIDGSSPWIPDPAICSPSQDMPASVDRP